MQITLSITNPEVNTDSDLLSLEIYNEMTLETLRSSIQAETGIHPNAQHLYHNGQLITDNSKTMEELQIGNGEMLALHVRDMRGTTGIPASGGGAAGRAGGGAPSGRRRAGNTEQDPELIRLQILGDPRLRAEFQRQQPQLAAALDDPQRFAQVYNENFERDQRERAERQRQIAQLNADPFDIEAQAKIEEIIRQERVMENLQNAMEHNPEVFGRVHMLYVDVEVNNHTFKALVDSGAQATIMSPSCAEACGIMRLVDKRFAGVARGIGTANIIGRVHSAQIKIGDLYLPCSFTVMEGKSVELLLGLDMLKRHQASIDLAKDKLIIQGHEIPFLGEADIPKEAEEALEDEPKITGPAGTTIGQKSGAVSAPSEAGPSSEQQQGQQQQQQQQGQQPAQAQAQAQAQPQAAGAGAAPTAPQHASQPLTSPEGFPNEKIEQLMALGFPRDDVVNALRITGGNVEYAASILFQL